MFHDISVRFTAYYELLLWNSRHIGGALDLNIPCHLLLWSHFGVGMLFTSAL